MYTHNCANCGSTITTTANFCTKCGYKIKPEVSFIDGMEGHEFEYFCAEILSHNGFSNVQVTPGSGDQGVDILAEKDGVKYAFQCKNYSSSLGNTPIQEVSAGKMFYGCHVGVVITNSTFTPGAIQLAKVTGVLLWGRNKLEDLISTAGGLKNLGYEAFEDIRENENFHKAISDDSNSSIDFSNPKAVETFPRKNYKDWYIGFITGIPILMLGIICLLAIFTGGFKPTEIAFPIFIIGLGLTFIILGIWSRILAYTSKSCKYCTFMNIAINKALFSVICILLAISSPFLFMWIGGLIQDLFK